MTNVSTLLLRFEGKPNSAVTGQSIEYAENNTDNKRIFLPQRMNKINKSNA